MRSQDEVVAYAKSCSLEAEKDRCTLKQLKFHVNQHLERQKQEYNQMGSWTRVLPSLANLALVVFVFQMMMRLISSLPIVLGER